MADDSLETKTLVETDNYMVYLSKEPDGETVYHIEMFNMTIHFFHEEWEEFVAIMEEVSALRK